MVVEGNLTIETVPALYEAGVRHLVEADLVVDFSRTAAVDSAAVGMLLGWTRAAQKSKRALRVTGLPENLISLAHLYGVSDMLPLQST